ncbi:VVA0879 family protein [Aminobacter sp. UC22_36]|uniref:VVA0879 family protein n=1 Tax=Aminobacter sp. UC22_36 TaxID=3374549 RepID=UPI003756CADD
MQTMTLPEFQTALKAQGVKSHEDFAFKCVICGTIQSGRSLIKAGAGKTFDDVEKFVGFSCVGRFTDAGPHKKGTAPGRGCDWSLGGLFTLHCLDVVDSEGKHHPRFELASPEEAQALAEQNAVAQVASC